MVVLVDIIVKKSAMRGNFRPKPDNLVEIIEKI